jgi:hypothetical protein
VRRAVAVVVVLLTAAGAVYAAGLGVRPDPAAQAGADGCGRDDSAAIQNLVAEWAYVNDKDYPATGPPPPPQWARGTISAHGGVPVATHVSGGDIPTTHNSYDVNLDVVPDAQSSFLVGGLPESRTGNFEGEGEETGRVHTELEQNAMPFFVWPEPGDHVEILGSWVWDCGHWLPGGERTEIHPMRAVWTVHKRSPRSPTGDAEGDLLITSEKTGAGRVADCAHVTKAVGFGQALRDCLAHAPRQQDVSGTYKFSLAAPPRPSASAKLAVRVVDAGSTRNAPRLKLVRSVRGASVSLTIPASAGPVAPRLVVARRILVGWRGGRTTSQLAHMRVRFVRLIVHRAMDPACPSDQPQCRFRNESTHLGQTSTLPAEWNVYWDVGGIWGMWRPTTVLVRRDGQAFPGSQTVDVFLPRGRPWRVFIHARECDFGALGTMDSPSRSMAPCPRNPREFGVRSGDDVPGIALAAYRSPERSVGVYHANAWIPFSTCPTSNKAGCYTVVFDVTRVR